MDIEILREFVEVAKQPNISKTAKKLNMSHSALSTHIAKLERELGVKLLDRGSANTITPEGKLFLEYATTITRAYDEGKAACKTAFEERSSRILVHIPPSISNSSKKLISETFAFRKEHPELSIRLVDEGTRTPIELLDERIVDVARVEECPFDPSEELHTKGIACFPLNRIEFVVWASIESDLIKKDTLALNDLANHTLIDPNFIVEDLHSITLKQLAEQLGTAFHIVTKSFFSEEEIHLSDFSTQEYLFCPRSYLENVPSVKLRDDMAIRCFTEPLYGMSYIGYRIHDDNPALLEFIDRLKQRASV